MGGATGLREPASARQAPDTLAQDADAEPNAAITVTATPTLLARWSNVRWLIALRSFAIFLCLWHLLSLWNGNPIQLPSPLRVLTALAELARDGELVEHATVSV